MLNLANELFALICMHEKSGKEIDCALASVGSFLYYWTKQFISSVLTGNSWFRESSIIYYDFKFLNYRLKEESRMVSYQVKCVTGNVITPSVKCTGLESCSVISVQCDVSSSEFINNLTCAFLNEGFLQPFLFSCSEVGIVIIAGSTSWMAGEHAMWRTGQIISLSSNHCSGISWTWKKSTHYKKQYIVCKSSGAKRFLWPVFRKRREGCIHQKSARFLKCRSL